MEFFWKKLDILVSRHLQLNGLSPISQTENFWFLLIMFFEAGTLKCGVPQASSSWTAPFSITCKWFSTIIIRSRLLFVCRWHLIFYQHEDVKKIENFLNKDFSSLFQWFIDNKQSVHFVKDRTKSILFLRVKGLMTSLTSSMTSLTSRDSLIIQNFVTL